MLKVILVDMENMQYEGYKLIPTLSDGNYEFVFFESCYTIQIPTYIENALQERGIDYSYEWVKRNANNKDTMDFQIIAYLALRTRLAEDGAEEYYILSGDSDFKLPSRYISEQAGVDVTVIKSLSAFVDGQDMQDRRITIDYIIECCLRQAESKQELHCLLQKTLKRYCYSSDIGEIYRRCLSSFSA